MVSCAGGWPATTVAPAKAGALITSRSLSAISLGSRARPRPSRRRQPLLLQRQDSAQLRGLVLSRSLDRHRGNESSNRWLVIRDVRNNIRHCCRCVSFQHGGGNTPSRQFPLAECQGFYGKNRWVTKTDLSPVPLDESAIRSVTPSQIYA
jgi:hypothetical protein